MNALIGLILLLSAGNPGAVNQPSAAAHVVQADKAIDPALEMLGRMTGGTWRTTGDFVAEFKYEWRIKGKAIRAVGVIAKGTPQEFPAEALYGWDPEAKKVYYLDIHGHETVYKGWAEVKNGKFVGDFEGIIGEKGHYRFEDELVDNDTLNATLLGRDKEGKWAKLHSLTFKRIK